MPQGFESRFAQHLGRQCLYGITLRQSHAHNIGPYDPLQAGRVFAKKQMQAVPRHFILCFITRHLRIS
jgi:hypothetical protein